MSRPEGLMSTVVVTSRAAPHVFRDRAVVQVVLQRDVMLLVALTHELLRIIMITLLQHLRGAEVIMSVIVCPDVKKEE
jgi:hypothetical protein